MPNLDGSFSLSELCLSLQSRLNLYLALSPITSLVMVAAVHGDHGAWGTEGGRRGLEAWTNGISGSQFAFPETDYWASLIRPLMMISFYGDPKK